MGEAENPGFKGECDYLIHSGRNVYDQQGDLWLVLLKGYPKMVTYMGKMMMNQINLGRIFGHSPGSMSTCLLALV